MIGDESVHLFLPCGFPNQEFKLQSSNCKPSSGKDPSAKAKLAGFHLTILSINGKPTLHLINQIRYVLKKQQENQQTSGKGVIERSKPMQTSSVENSH